MLPVGLFLSGGRILRGAGVVKPPLTNDHHRLAERAFDEIGSRRRPSPAIPLSITSSPCSGRRQACAFLPGFHAAIDPAKAWMAQRYCVASRAGRSLA